MMKVHLYIGVCGGGDGGGGAHNINMDSRILCDTFSRDLKDSSKTTSSN